MATIITKNSSTASSVPLNTQLVQGELAVNVTDKRLFTENASGTVVELGTNPSSLTLPNGTANGVPYLNGSKVLTTGSALTFDGTTFESSISGGTAFRATASTGTNNIRQQFINTGGTFSIGLDSSTGSIFGAAYAGVMWHGGNYPLVFGVNNSEQMRLTSTGLGIGTSSPAFKLDVGGVDGTNIALRSTGTSAARFRAYVNGAESGVIGFLNGGGQFFEVAGSERARIDSSGNFCVNTTATASGAKRATKTTSGQLFDVFLNGSGSTIGYIGNVSDASTVYATTSDKRLKENIEDADSASALIDSLQVRKFDWKVGSHQRYGFVAQELVTVVPEAVYQPSDPEDMMAVDYSKLVPILVKEIQSLRARISALEVK